MVFRISEKFRLEIHWNKVIYKQDGVATIEGCYLTGPVLKEVSQLNEKDGISLDFANQYRFFVPSYYIANLIWQGVKHTSNKIFLYNTVLTNKYVNSVPKLNNDDYIVVDTKNHEDEKHQRNLTYPSYLIKYDGEIYNFAEYK